MNQAPKITDRVLWVAVPKEIRNNTGRLVTHTGSCECGAHAHANPYREADGTFSCPVLRTPLPLNGLSKYTPPGKITEGWPVQVDSNVAHYIGKANEMGLQGVQISPIEVSERTRGIVNVTYSRAEDEAIAAWKSRVAAVEKSESDHVKYELPRIGRSAEYSVKRHEEAIGLRSKQRAAAQARLDVYRKAHAYYTQGQAPEKIAEKEPTQSPYHKMVSVRLDGDTIDQQADAQSYLLKGLVKVHNTETLNKLAPDNTRRTFGEVPIGAFFYYCSLEYDYNVAPGATAWQRISHTEALPVALIHRTDERALKIAPTKFDQGDIVAGVKVSE